MNENNISKENLIDLADSLLKDDHLIHLNLTGYSMFPLLHPGDTAYVQRNKVEDLRIGDVVVYKEKERIIAHRLIDLDLAKDNDKTTLRGDHCKRNDAPVRDENIIGKLINYQRKNKVHHLNTPFARFQRFKSLKLFPLSYYINHFYVLVVLLFDKLKEQIAKSRINLKEILKGSERQFKWNICLAVIQGLVPLALIVCIRSLIDFLSLSQIDDSGGTYFYLLLAVTALLFLASGILGQVQNYYLAKTTQSVSNRVHDRLHDKHGKLGLQSYETSDSQDVIHRAVQEASYRPGMLIGDVLGLIRSLSSGLVLIILFLTIRWYIVLILLIAVIPDAIVRLYISQKRYQLRKKQTLQERLKSYYNRVLTGFPYAKEIRLFDFSIFFKRKYHQVRDEIFYESLALTKKELKFSLASQLFGVLLIFGSLAIIASLKFQGLVTLGTVVLFFFAFQRGYASLNEFFRSSTRLIEDNSFIEDLTVFMNFPEQKTSGGNKLFSLNEEIQLKDVDFCYEKSKREALRNINLTIKKGQKVALVGENGSGKSTLIKLLCGFYTPTQGKITFDGKDAKQIGLKNVTENVTAVFQDFALYNVPASVNIAFGDMHTPYDIHKVIRAAQLAGVDDVLSGLPQGYNTMLGNIFPEGEELSMGQWQKMAIARAFYRDAPLILMDEPSSALDPRSESQITDRMKSLSEDKTAIIVSHRLSSVNWADKIVVLKQGEIVEIGSHEELMDKRGEYYSLVKQIR